MGEEKCWLHFFFVELASRSVNYSYLLRISQHPSSHFALINTTRKTSYSQRRQETMKESTCSKINQENKAIKKKDTTGKEFSPEVTLVLTDKQCEVSNYQQPLTPLTHIKTLTLTSSRLRHETEPDWNSDSLREFMLDVSSVYPKLEALSCVNFGMHSNPLPLHLVNILLQSSRTLKDVYLNCVTLAASQSELNEMSAHLQQHPHLESFRMSCCGFSKLPGMEECSLDPIVAVLLRLPNIKRVELWSYSDDQLGRLSHSSLQALIQGSVKLDTLHIEGFSLEDEHAEVVANALHNKTCSLQRLELHKLKQLSSESLGLLANSLRENSSLHYLELSLAITDDVGDSERYTSATPHCSFLTQLAQALIDNTVLIELRVHSYQKIRAWEEEAFAKVLETNTTLQFLHLAGYEGACRPKLEYYLAWNRRGRYPAKVLQEKCQIIAMVKSGQQEQKMKKDPRRRKKEKRANGLMRP